MKTDQPMRNSALDAVLQRAMEGKRPDAFETRLLLALRKRDQLERLFYTTRKLRHRFFGPKVFLYGFVYFSTYCRNNCRFCHFRSSNRQLRRYRKSEADIIDATGRLADAGVHLIDLTMGEDPRYLQEGDKGYDRLTRLVRHVKRRTGRPVMVSTGLMPEKVLKNLARAGADWYACYQETHNRRLFEQLRPGQSYEARWQAKINARRYGLLVEEGILAGVGETLDDIAGSIDAMDDLGADQVRIMTFVPRDTVLLKPCPEADDLREPVTLAVMRLMFPECLIPASLDIDGLDGLKQRLDAGANVITSLILPGEGLAGVAHHHLDIEDARRTPNGILPVLDSCRLAPAPLIDYLDWMERRRSDQECRRKRLRHA